MDYSERIFREEVAGLPDGIYEFIDYIDQDEGRPDHPPVKVHLKMRIEGDQVTLDFRDSDPTRRALGLSYPALLSASFDGTLHIFPHSPSEPRGHPGGQLRDHPGHRRPHPATHPERGYCAGAYEKVDASVMACWAQAFAAVDRAAVYAGTVNLQNCCVGGIHPETKLPYVSYIWIEGGQGARADSDGASGLMMLFVSSAGNQPIEIHERWYPMYYTNCEYVPDSCGDGKYRGGFGVMRNWGVMVSLLLNVHGDRTKHGPYSSRAAPTAARTS